MLHIISIAILIATLAAIGLIIWTFIRAWKVETGTLWERTLRAGKDSATIVWSKLVIVSGALLAVVASLSDVVGDGSLTAQVQPYLTPQVVGYVAIGIAVINIAARLRTLGK